ncbi:helix-turn-helix domain-containing protein [Wenjunlia tyrosinilytica]|uniref:Cyclic diguanylate phosphodiesterase n=1 Tax=Wenjunlia tyrosinilytica TaxID=1544741 RepID=A0A917ZWK3_9ACTN|nr:GAF domain-containing protein [Wenjunlia tyrosinilytica]GGO96090.1 cyclic diguanylate phosphodiesterase [Wenjunlia tyrosinilytica]
MHDDQPDDLPEDRHEEHHEDRPEGRAGDRSEDRAAEGVEDRTPDRPGRPAGPEPTGEAAYLELLVRGAAAEEYELPLRRARAAGAAPEHVAALERARLSALRVRNEIEGRRRRETELTALFETANDLAGLRDLDSVLQAIVHRARSLLGTDVAYLSLNDTAAGDTYMRVTAGSVSARFQRVRLGMGEGLGGLVAQTALPYVTESYFEDARFQHTRPIDSAVHDEGLVAILGVPLVLGRDVIGVLFAADRRARVFEREQISLLSSLATHAAIAIDTANLLQETRSALAELGAANEIIRNHSAAIERASEVHDRLTEVVLRGGGVREVASALSEVLSGDVRVVQQPDRPLEEAVSRSREDGHAVRHGDFWVAAVAAGGEPLGALVLGGHPDLDPIDQRTLERAAMVTSLLLLSRRSAVEAEQRVRGELLDDLLDAPDRDPRLMRERAARLGADLDAPYTLLTARIDRPTGAEDAADRQRLWSAASHLAAVGHGLASARDGGTVLLLPAEEVSASATARRVAKELGAAVNAPVTVGSSAPVDAPAAGRRALAAAHAEARRCLETLRVLGRRGEAAAPADFGFLGLLLADTRDVEGFVRRTIGPVLDYDARRGTELERTLRAYFASGMSPVRTKDELHVHVNTVAQRVERIGRLLGGDWQCPERALEIQLALRLRRLSTCEGSMAARPAGSAPTSGD